MSVSKVSYVLPCYNEAETLEELYQRLSALAHKLDHYEFEWLFVDDASTDETPKILDRLAAADVRVKVLRLAANRGHQMALTTGLDFATGDVIVTMDADLQDPPELIGPMLDKILEGYDVVHAQRRGRAGETKFKLITARLFYSLIRKLSPHALLENVGDFRAFTRPVLKAACAFREPHRFLRGMFVLVGFRQGVVQYDRERRHAGRTKYPLRKMIRFAVDGLMGFSSAPLRFFQYTAAILWTASLVVLLVVLYGHLILHRAIAGWTVVAILLMFFGSLNLLCFAVVGAYVGRIFEQGKARPLYWLSETRNISLRDDDEGASPHREVALSKAILRAKQKRFEAADGRQERPGGSQGEVEESNHVERR